MKKNICLISVLILLLSCFSACGDKKEDVNLKKEETSGTTENIFFDRNSDFVLGEEVATSVYSSGSDKQIVHIDEFGDYIIMDHCDSKGNVIYYEKPVYNTNGDIRGYEYYDVDMNYIGATDTENNFYDADGVCINENIFTAALQKAKNKKSEKE